MQNVTTAYRQVGKMDSCVLPNGLLVWLIRVTVQNKADAD